MRNKCKINNYKFKKCLHLIQMMTKQTIENLFTTLGRLVLLYSEIQAQGSAYPSLSGLCCYFQRFILNCKPIHRFREKIPCEARLNPYKQQKVNLLMLCSGMRYRHLLFTERLMMSAAGNVPGPVTGIRAFRTREPSGPGT
jgi:hypothetical protein